MQKFCEGGRNALLFGLTCQDKAHDSFPILCRSLGSARDANNCKYTSADDTPASVLYRRYHARCRYRTEELRPDCYAVVERQTSAIVISGFPSYEAAWSWIANQLGAHYENWARSARQI